MKILGIDVGGSGIKGALVDTKKGELITDRFRLRTPTSRKPVPMAKVVAKVANHFSWQDPIGCGFPTVIHHGVAKLPGNLHEKWVNTDIEALFAEHTGCLVTVVNDADAAGLAEMTFGAGKGQDGVVIVITIGTGLGTAVFTSGHLVPSTEFGHLEMNCFDAEEQASDAARQREKLSWKEWAKRFDQYLNQLNMLFWPDLIILGGGGSKKFNRFESYLTVPVKVVPAQLLNEAGIVGAALAAKKKTGDK
ncbi:MAG: ROK family protein [Anaerolineales bacterium]|nr:ROK family protein [Anaerolineales bacterium]